MEHGQPVTVPAEHTGGHGEVESQVFVGRQDELERFEIALGQTRDDGAGGDSWPRVIVVHGLGGIGKSRLLERFRAMTDRLDAAVWIDWEDERRTHPAAFGGDLGPGLITVLDVVQRTFVEELERHKDGRYAENAFDGYRSAVTDLPRVQERLRSALATKDEQSGASKEELTAIGQAAAAIGAVLSGQPLLPEAVNVASAATQAFAAQAPKWKRLMLGGPMVPPDEYALLADPQRVLAEHVGRAVAAISELRPVVVFVDTVEIVLAQMPWLRQMMRASGGRVLWVVGGRLETESEAGRDSEIAAFVRQVPDDRLKLMALTRFDDAAVAEYLARRIPERVFGPEDVDRVAEFTGGMPLAVGLVANLLETGAEVDVACAELTGSGERLDPRQPGEVVAALARRFLVHSETHGGPMAMQDLHRILCLAMSYGTPRDDPGLLRALWNTDDDLFSALQDLASRHDFVLSGSFRIHQDVRSVLQTDLFDPVRRTRVQAANQRAVAYLTDRLATRRAVSPGLEQQIADDLYLTTLLELIWHRYWLDSTEGWGTVLSILPVLASHRSLRSAAVRMATEHQQDYPSVTWRLRRWPSNWVRVGNGAPLGDAGRDRFDGRPGMTSAEHARDQAVEGREPAAAQDVEILRAVTTFFAGGPLLPQPVITAFIGDTQR